MIVDAHQHFWDIDRFSYPWLGPDLGPIYCTFSEADLAPELDACGVDWTVLVQAANSVADTEYMLEVADRWPRVAGVVGWVPLARPEEAETILDRYQRSSRLVGVRHLLHEEDEADWLLRSDVSEGLAVLAERDLCLDVPAAIPDHLYQIALLAQRLPRLRVVIDHLGKPPIREGQWEPWARLLADAAPPPNVSAKISGLTPRRTGIPGLPQTCEYGSSMLSPASGPNGSCSAVTGPSRSWRATTRGCGARRTCCWKRSSQRTGTACWAEALSTSTGSPTSGNALRVIDNASACS